MVGPRHQPPLHADGAPSTRLARRRPARAEVVLFELCGLTLQGIRALEVDDPSVVEAADILGLAYSAAAARR
jgi:hypothetical protein